MASCNCPPPFSSMPPAGSSRSAPAAPSSKNCWPSASRRPAPNLNPTELRTMNVFRSAALGVVLALAALSLATHADEPQEPAADPNAAPARNPYLPPASLQGLSLYEYLLRMMDRPDTIRTRPGFAEAVDQTVDRL